MEVHEILKVMLIEFGMEKGGDILIGQKLQRAAIKIHEKQQVKKLNIDDVSKCECGETKDLITVCEDCTYKMVSEGN